MAEANKNVFLIDDDPFILDMYTLKFKEHGFGVDSARNGKEALDYLKDSQPNLILMDIDMPVMDGYQTCELIKSHPHFKKIPIVMLTSKDTLFDRARGKLVGAEQNLIKPFNKRSLIKAVITNVRRGKEESQWR